MNTEKRIILALFLSILILSVYSLSVRKFHTYPVVNKEDTTIVKNTNLPPETPGSSFFSKFSRAPVSNPEKPLGSIAKFLLSGLKFFYKYLHNWGLAVIVLSLAIWLALYPLTAKSLTSTKKMQSLQPKIEALRQQYKSDPQKLNKEIFGLYKINKINPLGGCLPLVLQMPIFFGLYQMLSRSQELKGAQFLWIKDLASTDKLYTFSFASGSKFDLNLLPILMMALMFFQQKISLKSTAGVSSEQQRMFATVFPIMFGVMFYNFPAGLVLYWAINSLLMFIQQLKINRIT